MQYKDQSASALNLSLFAGDFDREAISVLISDTFFIDEGIVEVGIIGASHFCSIRNENESFTEMFACVSIGDCIVGAANKAIIFTGKYNFSSKVHHFKSEKTFIEFINDFKNSKDIKTRVDLSFNFETKNNLPAITSVQVFESEDFINITTIHAYPNEMNIVKTQSQLSKKILLNGVIQ